MKITYWSDFACPYCFIGNVRLKKAIKELGIADKIEFDIHAFELDPNAPKHVETTTVERFAKKYSLSLADSKKEVDNISQMGIDEGIDFKYATTLYTNTRDAHRLIKLAQSKKDHTIVDTLNNLLFDAYFTKNLKLSDKNVLMDISLESGLEESEVSEVLNSNLYENEVEEDEKIAYTAGITGVPFYLFDGKYSVPGTLSYDDFKKLLIQILEESKVDENDDVNTCKDGVCKL